MEFGKFVVSARKAIFVISKVCDKWKALQAYRKRK